MYADVVVVKNRFLKIKRYYFNINARQHIKRKKEKKEERPDSLSRTMQKKNKHVSHVKLNPINSFPWAILLTPSTTKMARTLVTLGWLSNMKMVN